MTGTVAVETDYFNDLADRPQGFEHGRAIVMHELGHLSASRTSTTNAS